MRSLPGGDPFAVLGLPARPGLTGDEVRAAWRRIATATHPDRADGGDPERFALAAAAYTVLRTASGRGEALADLASPLPPQAGPAPPATSPPGALPAAGHPATPGARRPARLYAVRLLSRVRRGRPARLALRIAIAAAAGAVAVVAGGFQPATPALITGAITWLILTARHDLAP